MASIVVVAQCKDQAKWEAGFKTHGEFFRMNYGVTKPVSYGMADDNYVVASFEPDDVAGAMKAVESPETIAAMQSDGLLLETVKVFVLDQELRV